MCRAQPLPVCPRPKTRILQRGGTPSRVLYIIRKGTVRLERDGAVVQVLEEGECFGFPFLIGRPAPHVDIVAAEEVLLYQIPGGVFDRLMAHREFATLKQETITGLEEFMKEPAQTANAPQNLARLEAALREEINRAVKDGFTTAELVAAKSGWLQSQQVTRANDSSLAFQLSDQLFAGRKLEWTAALEKKVTDLTTEQVNGALRKYIDPATLSIVKAGDFAKAAAAK
ncbi:MAG: cyclic nucleotide-binding domain-containing protein [Acidobacteriota bacterium]